VLLRLAERNRLAAYVVEANFRVFPLKVDIRSPGAGFPFIKGRIALRLIGKFDDPEALSQKRAW
jgi:hypothetical protein